MELMTWTDERLEERFAHVDARFDRLEAVVAVKSETRELQKELTRLTTEVQTLRDEIGALRDEMTKEFRALRSELHGDRRALIIALIAAIVAILVKGG
jgi:uncharacterized coiled-coil DUF342 family protein